MECGGWRPRNTPIPSPSVGTFSVACSDTFPRLSFLIYKMKDWGLPWRSSGEDSTLPLWRAQVQPLVGELRSCMALPK